MAIKKTYLQKKRTGMAAKPVKKSPKKALTAAQKARFTPDLLPLSTVVEVIRVSKQGVNVKKIMNYGAWKAMKKQQGFTYTAYQKGFSQFVL
jgi:hypothetical protein